MFKSIVFSFLCLLLTSPANAHWGHLGELAGHGHVIAVGAAAAAAALAAALIKPKSSSADDELADETEEEATGETA